MISIIDLELAKLEARMAEKGLELDVRPDAKDFLVDNGTDEKFGARPLRRAIGQFLEDPLSEAMLRGQFEGQNKVIVTFKPSEIEGERGELALEGVVVDTEELEPVGAHSDDT